MSSPLSQIGSSRVAFVEGNGRGASGCVSRQCREPARGSCPEIHSHSGGRLDCLGISEPDVYFGINCQELIQNP